MTDKKYNVLFLSSWYPNRVAPTLGNFVQKHAEAVALHSNVVALNVSADDACKNKYEVEEQAINNVYTINVYYKKVNHNIPLLSPLQKFITYFKAHLVGINRIPKSFRIDLVHQNVIIPSGIVALYLKKLRNIPYIATEHSTIYLGNHIGNLSFIQKLIVKSVARSAGCITPVSHNLMKAMERNGIKGNYTPVYNVVDTHLFKPAEYKTGKEKIKFLHISTLDDRHKNISGMLRAISKLAHIRSDFEFLFIGDGDLEPHLKNASNLGILNSVAFFEGTKTTSEVASSMQKADCFVLFSNYENLPVVIIEAFASGLPVIATNVGGISEHLSEQFGVLIEAKDEEGLFNALNKMIGDIRLKKYAVQRLRSYAEEKFSYEQVSKKFHEIYHQINA